MDLESVILNEVREGEISCDITYMWNLRRNDTNELTKQKQTHRLRKKKTYGCQGEGIGSAFGKVKYTLLYLFFKFTLGFPGGSEDKASACNAGHLGSIPGSGRCPREGNGNPLQYSSLENPMDREAW